MELQKRAFKIAQELSCEAVAGGSAGGYGFDWDIAMIYLQVATGHAPIEKIEQIDRMIEDGVI